MRQIVIDSLRKVLERKRAENIGPSEMVLYNELLIEVGNRIRFELNELHKSGSIRVGNTINDKYIVVTEQEILRQVVVSDLPL